MEAKYIVAIEIGSSKIKGAIGVVDIDSSLKVIAVEECEFIDGVRYGCIQNVEDVKTCVSKIISALESNAQVVPQNIKGVYVSIGGRSTKSHKNEIERIFDEETEITREIIDELINQAYEEFPKDKHILDIVSLGYAIDNTTPQNPIGTYGHSLKTTLNYITCRPQIIKNINRVIEERLSLDINGFIVRQSALADLVLSIDEKKLGCMLVDFGAEITTVSIHKGGAMQYMATIPLGSRNITRDLTTLSITEEVAERVKRAANVNPQETVGAAGRSSMIEGVDDSEVNNYVQYRSREIIANIINQITLGEYKTTDLPNGIIIVGGGAKLKGFNSYLEAQSGLKVRVGMINGKVRVLDNSISQEDALDVISVLYAASQMKGLEECLEGPKQVVIEPQEDVVMGEPVPKEDPQENKEKVTGTNQDKDKKPSTRNSAMELLKKVKDKVTKMLEEED